METIRKKYEATTKNSPLNNVVFEERGMFTDAYVEFLESLIDTKIVPITHPVLTTKRRDGNTTRQIDANIQELFTTRKTILCDHTNTQKNNTYLRKVFLQRLNMEHGVGCAVNLNDNSVILLDTLSGKLIE